MSKTIEKTIEKTKEIDSKITTVEIIAKLPSIVTPSILSKYYGMNDGGKLLRRHLRKNFTVENSHEYNNKWEWINNGENDKLNNVINYCNERYVFAEIKTS